MIKSHYGVTHVQKRAPELAKKKSEIFLITVIRIPKDDSEAPFFPRTIGYSFDLKEAIDGLFGGNVSEYVTHAVIEVFPPGVAQEASKEHWFARTGTSWKPCEKPASQTNTINFAIG